MEKVYFCTKNEFKTNKAYNKSLKSSYPDLKIKRKGCLGKCKTCKQCPFTLIDGKIMKSETGKDLYSKINKRILKESV
ncbi:DUF1450 domain-containing protein [Halalkalibacter kiskunsagensis]|uniref:DUF1450 domain-containing protein n=2 Tax=Halalkalibacter kiskunsagensis TaxID=1548599 RepID=A0ABV6KGG8_9BACI